jgi:hypothetical protein
LKVNFLENSVSIPKNPSSLRLTYKESIFMGISGYAGGDVSDMEGLNFYKIEQYYFVSRSKGAHNEAMLDFTVITL